MRIPLSCTGICYSIHASWLKSQTIFRLLPYRRGGPICFSPTPQEADMLATAHVGKSAPICLSDFYAEGSFCRTGARAACFWRFDF